jgi:ribose 5-phosphate isomerase B
VIVALGSDHAGIPLREAVIATIVRHGHEILDCGADRVIPGDDYPDYAAAVARAVAQERVARGVLLCGSGVGASIAANKFVGVYAALCHDTFSARQGVEDDQMNVLCVGARVVGPSLCEEIVAAFLAARFSGAERHVRRVGKIRDFERAAHGGSSAGN